jgi:hypothetical protein
LEEIGQVSGSVRRGLANGIRQQLQRLYHDQIQALRDYYGRRYESILDQTKIETSVDEMQIEREWATAAEHMTQGFRAAAQNSVPVMLRNNVDKRDFEYVKVLEGLIKDMMESTERRKDDLVEMGLVNDDRDGNDAGNKKKRRINIPRWLERFAARAFVFGVNYIQGWLAWQGIKRAALERDRIMPKFPLF